MVLGKKVAIFYWVWGRNLAPEEGQKMPCNMKKKFSLCKGFNPSYDPGYLQAFLICASVDLYLSDPNPKTA